MKVVAYPISLIYYFFFFLLLLAFHPIQVVCYRIVGYSAHKKSVNILNFLLIICLKIVGTRITFVQKKPLKKGETYIFACNHQSTYDIPPLIWYLRHHHAKFISKKELGNGIPSISFNLRHGGGALIDRKDRYSAVQEIKEFCHRVQKNQWSVVIFPEGTRSRDGNPKAFQQGGLKTLLSALPKAKLVPVSISHSWKLARWNYFPLPLGVHIKFTVHPPEDPDGKQITKRIAALEKIVVDNIIPG